MTLLSSWLHVSKNIAMSLQTLLLRALAVEDGLDFLQIPAASLDEEEIHDQCTTCVDQDVEDVKPPGHIGDSDGGDVGVDDEHDTTGYIVKGQPLGTGVEGKDLRWIQGLVGNLTGCQHFRS